MGEVSLGWWGVSKTLRTNRSTGDGTFAGYSVTIKKGCTEFIAATAPFGPETGIARYRHSQDEECDDQELISSVVDVIEKFDGVEEQLR